MMKQNDKIVYVAQAYSNAETVGVVEETTCFVPQMIVGEQAVVKVNYVKKNVAYADVVELLQPSCQRVVPPCKHFGKCGGCTLMHMTYAEQLVFKQNKVANNLKKIGGINADVLPCVPSPKVLGYRNKLSLPVRGKVGNVKIGMYERGSHNIVDADTCLLGDSWTTVLVSVLRNFFNREKIVPYNEKNFTGQIRHVVARCVDNQLLVTLVVNGSFDKNLLPLLDTLQKHFSKVGLFVNQNTKKNNVILGDVTKHIGGIKYIEGSHLNVKFQLAPNSFFQVNDEVKDGIYLKVKELLNLSQTQVLVDCFSGIGILTTVLAEDKFVTYAIELEPSAVADADRLKKLNNSPNVTNVCGDVAVELPKLCQKHGNQVLSLVVDPPRKGLGEKVCQTILQANVDNVVYVSCDSATLARDLAILSENYTVRYVQPWDMFPNTAEVETVVHLVKNK